MMIKDFDGSNAMMTAVFQPQGSDIFN